MMLSIQAKRILFVQPSSIEPPGGGNAVAAWMIQALKDAHRITLLTWAPPALDSVNRFFGTDLSGGDFELRVCASHWSDSRNCGPPRCRYCGTIS